MNNNIKFRLFLLLSLYLFRISVVSAAWIAATTTTTKKSPLFPNDNNNNHHHHRNNYPPGRISFFLKQNSRCYSEEEEPPSSRRGGSGNNALLWSSKQKPPRLVLLIPAYNEERRIGTTLETYRDVLAESSSYFGSDCRMLVVDDGSRDETRRVVQSFSSSCNANVTKRIPTIECISLPTNQGKGAAVSRGIQHIVSSETQQEANNTVVLILDADGSGDLEYLDSIMERLNTLLLSQQQQQLQNQTQTWQKPPPIIDYSLPAIVTGNRRYELFSPRGITRWGFQTCVRLITLNSLRVKDTQCGYKCMTLSAAKHCYADLHLLGWSHDVEALKRAALWQIPIEEIPINWKDIQKGSKVVESGVVRVSVQMLLDILRLQWEYSITKRWK